MNPPSPLWDKLRHPRGPLTRAVRRAGLSAVGTYAAYVAYGLRHPELLRSRVTPNEIGDALPGDELVDKPNWVTNFAIDINAPPEEVWPWLVQMGFGRAGYYAWFPLDNGGVPCADTIIPALQELKVGDIVPDGPRAKEGFGLWRVEILDRERALVLRSRRQPTDGREVPPETTTGSFIDISWAFVLASPGPGRTRLRVRVRARFHGARAMPLVVRASRLFFGFGDNVMENTMLTGIRDRAERRMRERRPEGSA
jgi:hypothetical protein